VMLKLVGIIPPVVTPVNEDESIDEDSLTRQLKRLKDEGVHGLFILGSAGEFVSLRDSERRKVIQTSVANMKGKLPILVGTMDTSTLRTIENAKVAEDMGADAVVVTAPFYYNHSSKEVMRHFELVSKSVNIPVVIYNIPQLTKFNMQPEEVVSLSNIENIIGIKDSSGSYTNLLSLLEALGDREDFFILIGEENLAGIGMAMGADGAIMAIANIAPNLSVKIYEAAKAGRLDELKQLQAKLRKLMQIYEFGTPISCLKVALSLMGIGNGKACEPFEKLSDEAYEGIKRVLSEVGLLP